MSIIDNAKKHFQQRQDIRGPISVPEWEADIYYQIPNMQIRAEMARALDEGGLEGIVTVLILMALDENGNSIFKKAQKAELMRGVDPEVIQRVTAEMDITSPDMGE